MAAHNWGLGPFRGGFEPFLCSLRPLSGRIGTKQTAPDNHGETTDMVLEGHSLAGWHLLSPLLRFPKVTQHIEGLEGGDGLSDSHCQVPSHLYLSVYRSIYRSIYLYLYLYIYIYISLSSWDHFLATTKTWRCEVTIWWLALRKIMRYNCCNCSGNNALRKEIVTISDAFPCLLALEFLRLVVDNYACKIRDMKHTWQLQGENPRECAVAIVKDSRPSRKLEATPSLPK